MEIPAYAGSPASNRGSFFIDRFTAQLAAKAAVSSAVAFTLLAQPFLVQASSTQLPTIGPAAYTAISRTNPHTARSDVDADALGGHISHCWTGHRKSWQDQQSR
jgi:hypothetical protein